LPSEPTLTHYFCYGSNMVESMLLKAAPNLEAVSPARIHDWALRFNRSSTTWQGGAADISPQPGLTVWGRLFRFDGKPEWAGLDRKEGAHSGAYERRAIEVEVFESAEASVVWAATYMVPDIRRPSNEIPPSDAYLKSMLLGAREGGLPTEYIRFLEWLLVERRLHEQRTRGFRDGLLVLPTVNRTGAGAGPLLILNQIDADKFSIRRHAAVKMLDRPSALARVATGAGDPRPGTCRLDQNIRHVLTHRTIETYGYHVDVEPVTRARTPRLSRLMRSRVILLRVDSPALADSEKGIAVLSEKNLKFLGLDSGDRVTMTALRRGGKSRVRGSDGSLGTASISLRTYTGSADDLKHAGRDIYPSSSVIAIDREARDRLGVELGAPLWVRASIKHLFLGRVLYYALAAIGLVFTLNGILDEGLGIRAPYRLGLALVLSAFATATLAYLDIRHKVHA
jgi:cation transport regulator ChaC